MPATPRAGRRSGGMAAAVLLAACCAVAPLPSPAAARPSYPYYYPQYGQYRPYYCYAYPANCAQPLSNPFYSYPPSYNLDSYPNDDHVWPRGGGVGFGIIVGPVFGFAPGIVVRRGFILRR